MDEPAHPVPRVDTAFGLDRASLAAGRVLFAIALLLDLGERLIDLSAHYTDAGILPRALLLEAFPGSSRLCLHLASGGFAWALSLHLILMGAAVAIGLGRGGKAPVGIALVLLLSLQARNPLTSFGGDQLARLFLLWSLLLPEPGLPAGGPGPRILGTASAGYVFQVCLVYWCAVLHKSGPAWGPAGTAVSMALAYQPMAWPWTWVLADRQVLCRALTYAVVLAEIGLPLLLVMPLGPRVRTLGAVGLVGLHVGFGLFMDLGVFPLYALAFLAPLLPGRWFEARVRGLWPPAGEARPDPGPSRALEALALALAAGSLAANLDTLPGSAGLLPARLRAALPWIGLDQRWDLFSPEPPRTTGWWVAVAVARDGSRRDLISGTTFRWEDPPRNWWHFRHRWFKVHIALQRAKDARRAARLQKAWADWMVREARLAAPEAASIRTVELTWCWLEGGALKRRVLWRGEYR